MREDSNLNQASEPVATYCASPGISHCYKFYDIIEYIVITINEFAQRYMISTQQAANYLVNYKGVEFLEKSYPAEHTLSVKDWVDDVTAVCKRNGGNIG